MSVLLCLEADLEARVIEDLASTRDEHLVVRRCADLVEVVAAARARVGRLAIVGMDREGLSISLLEELRGYVAIGLVAGETETGTLNPEAVNGLRERDKIEVLDADHRSIAQRIRQADDPQVAHPSGLRREGNESRVVAFWGPRGSHGRTTLVRDVAASVDSALVVDADAFAPSVAQFLDVDETSAIIAAARLIERGRPLQVDQIADRPARPFGNVRVIQGMNEAKRWREVSRSAADRLWDACRREPLTLIDLSGGLDPYPERVDRSALTRSALEHADAIVHVSSATPTGLRRLIEHLDLVDLEDGKDHVVAVTGVRSTSLGSGPVTQIDALLREVGMGDLTWIAVRDDRDRLDSVLLNASSMPAAFPKCQYTKDARKLGGCVVGDKLKA